MILLLTVFINVNEPEDREITGISYDIKTTQSGYTFSLEDTNGKSVRCFFKTEPSELNVYSVKGTFSDDGSMLFVSSMRQIEHNEF